MNSEVDKPRSRRRYAWLYLAAPVIVGLVAWAQWRALASRRDTLDLAHQQLAGMRSDAERIRQFREAPRAAVSRARTNEELLAQVERALSAAGIDRQRWLDSVPQPPVRDTGSPYVRHATRLYMEAIEPRQLAALVVQLESDDTTLRVSALQWAARPDGRAFNAEMELSYLVFAPGARGGTTG